MTLLHRHPERTSQQDRGQYISGFIMKETEQLLSHLSTCPSKYEKK